MDLYVVFLQRDVHLLVGRQAEGAAVGQLHHVDGEALVSALVAEAELHLGAAQRQTLLVGAQEQVSGDARPGGDIHTHTGYQLDEAAKVLLKTVLQFTY